MSPALQPEIPPLIRWVSLIWTPDNWITNAGHVHEHQSAGCGKPPRTWVRFVLMRRDDRSKSSYRFYRLLATGTGRPDLAVLVAVRMSSAVSNNRREKRAGLKVLRRRRNRCSETLPLA